MDTISRATWPPPPDIPDPLAAHDAFLTVKVLASVTELPLSRMRLVMALRKATMRDTRQCRAVVNYYCERHGIFPQLHGIKAWLPSMPSLVQLALLANMVITQIRLSQELAAAHTRHARHSILSTHVHWDGLWLCLFFVLIVASQVNMRIYGKRIRREAEDASQKVSIGFGAR